MSLIEDVSHSAVYHVVQLLDKESYPEIYYWSMGMYLPTSIKEYQIISVTKLGKPF